MVPHSGNAAKTGALIALLAAQTAFAFSGGLEDRLADIISTIVLIFVPIGGVVLFWKVHILPEIAAEKRHHPQKEAIKVLCIMSLLFGGLLWPFAWLWAYTKPVGYRAAYGRDKTRQLRRAGSHSRRTETRAFRCRRRRRTPPGNRQPSIAPRGSRGQALRQGPASAGPLNSSLRIFAE